MLIAYWLACASQYAKVLLLICQRKAFLARDLLILRADVVDLLERTVLLGHAVERHRLSFTARYRIEESGDAAESDRSICKDRYQKTRHYDGDYLPILFDVVEE